MDNEKIELLSKELSLKLADKLENNKMEVADVYRAIDNFFTLINDESADGSAIEQFVANI